MGFISLLRAMGWWALWRSVEGIDMQGVREGTCMCVIDYGALYCHVLCCAAHANIYTHTQKVSSYIHTHKHAQSFMSPIPTHLLTHMYQTDAYKHTHTPKPNHSNTHNHIHVHWHIYIQTHISFNCWTAISSAWISQSLWQFSNLEVHFLITNARKASKGKAIDPHTTDAAANHVPKELFCLKSAVLGELHWSASRSSGSFDAPGRWPKSSGHGALLLYFRQIFLHSL